MPLKIIQSNDLSPAGAIIQHELLAELGNPREFGQPLILERHMNRDGAVHIYVIWDRLDDCADRERSEIVLGAVEQLRGEAFRKRVVLAIGLTVPEATEMGLLPYSLVSTVRQADAKQLESLRQAMVAEGASTLDHSQRPLLRYPSLEDAESGLKRLNARVGTPDCFTIVHELR